MQNQAASMAPFACTFSPQLPELLSKLNCTIAISTYQAGKLVFISPKNEDELIQLPRSFQKPMGIGYQAESDRIALATKDEVLLFSNSPELAEHYPRKPNTYDALWVPRAAYYTNALDLHDLSFGSDGLYAVNTLFSCLVKIDEHYNFTPVWKPTFISKIASEDRCHLNGMAMQNGKPKYVTAFGQGNKPQSWRETLTETGVVIDVETNELIADDLGMPHSPMLYNNKLYVLLSATGELICIDPKDGSRETVFKTEAFLRGMSMAGEYLFIGTSKLRENSSTFAKLDIANKAKEAGLIVIHLPTAAFTAKLTYQNSVDEIYDVQMLKNKKRPNILNTLTNDFRHALVIPNTTYWANPEKAKTN
jgi:uncharacterized protein (TIGR03032 family)